jgi:hypothetical protein
MMRSLFPAWLRGAEGQAGRQAAHNTQQQGYELHFFKDIFLKFNFK